MLNNKYLYNIFINLTAFSLNLNLNSNSKFYFYNEKSRFGK